MAMMHSQINRVISSVISDRVIPEIRNIVSSMSSSGIRDTEASSSPNSQENKENNVRLKTKTLKNVSRSTGDLRSTEDLGPYTYLPSMIRIQVTGTLVMQTNAQDAEITYVSKDHLKSIAVKLDDDNVIHYSIQRGDGVRTY